MNPKQYNDSEFARVVNMESVNAPVNMPGLFASLEENRHTAVCVTSQQDLMTARRVSDSIMLDSRLQVHQQLRVRRQCRWS